MGSGDAFRKFQTLIISSDPHTKKPAKITHAFLRLLLGVETIILEPGNNIKIIGNQEFKNVLNKSKLNTWYTPEFKYG